MFVRHPEPQLKRCHSEPQLKECHVLNPYPEPQFNGYVSSHSSRNTSKLTFEVSPKPCRPCTLKTSKTPSCCNTCRLALLTRHQALSASRSPSEGHIPPGAKRLEHTNSATTAWQDHPHRQAYEF